VLAYAPASWLCRGVLCLVLLTLCRVWVRLKIHGQVVARGPYFIV
jgi:hypothetical protein